MRSYRECPSYDKMMGKKKRNLVPDEKLCKHAVNCRACRRCSQVPQYKLELWRKEKESPKGQSGVEGGIITLESHKLPKNTAVGHPNEVIFPVSENEY